MSYYLKVLKDYPIGFWQLDDVAINASFDFNDILDNFSTYQDLLDNYSQYGSINYIVTDSSGCNNNGVYVGDFNNSKQHFPLSPGGQYAVDISSTKSIEMPITNSYYKESAEGGFATKYYNDNDFTLECWIDPEIVTDNETTIFGDTENNIGIFWQNGNIIFKLDQDSLEYTIPFTNRVLHIVCVYSVLNAYIYINGEMVAAKQILDNPFTNNNILLKSGPTQDIEDIFLADDFAAYRYSLSSSQILDHYQDKGYTIPSQIVNPDNGELFEFYDNSLKTSFKYSYPLDKSWENFLTNDLYYDEIEEYIQIAKTETALEKEVVFTDLISIPSGINMDSSKIEWYGNNGIKVESSLDDISYVECKNGEALPQYTYSDFNEQRFLYIRVTLSSVDASRYLPKLYNLSIYFYNTQSMFSQNGSSYISKIDECDYYLGLNKYLIMHKDSRNGILVPENSGFYINLSRAYKSIEFFYTPDTISKSGLIKSDNTEYSWNQNGSINKTNIDSIFVNGQEVTSETSISDIFTENNLHHVVINFTEADDSIFTINYKASGSVRSLYQYVSFYGNNLNYNQIIEHYNLYTSKSSYQSSGATISMSENSVSLYNNDWLVIQNV
jgi:hypothetical protein